MSILVLNSITSICRALTLGLIACTTSSIVIGGGVPDGWRMQDRFVGFRYEIFPTLNRYKDIKVDIQGKQY